MLKLRNGHEEGRVRLQKILAEAGVSSRRAAEKLILEGRVAVNGTVVSTPGAKANPHIDHIKVDGKLLLRQEPKVCILLNKPRGYVCTTRDEKGRPTVLDLVRHLKIRVYPVGRLDYNTEGALLLSNAGELAELLMHPRHHVPKRYLVKVRGTPAPEQLRKLERGVHLDDGVTAPCRISVHQQRECSTWLEVTLYEGKYRQLRRMFDKIGHQVTRIKRVAYGCLTLEGLKQGESRPLNEAELGQLRRMTRKPC
jgi:pseudouridine synthase